MVAAGLVVRSTLGRVLVLETTYKSTWEVVGGVVEPGEGLMACVGREVREELGVDLPVSDLLVLDACPATADRPEILCALFDGGVHDETLLDRFSYPDGEIAGAHWVDRETALHRCGPRLGVRLTAALDALADGRLPGPALLLLNGTPERPITRS